MEGVLAYHLAVLVNILKKKKKHKRIQLCGVVTGCSICGPKRHRDYALINVIPYGYHQTPIISPIISIT